MIFQCKKCGSCCKQTPQNGDKNSRQILVYPEEADMMQTLAKIKEISVTLTEELPIPDKKNKQMIVTRYILEPNKDHDCPFLAEDECLIYDQRPMVCRAYPLVINEKSFVEHNFYIDRNCPAYGEILGDSGKLEMEKIKDVFPIEYRELLKVFRREKMILKKLSELEKDGKIKLEPNLSFEEFDEGFRTWERFIVYTEF